MYPLSIIPQIVHQLCLSTYQGRMICQRLNATGWSELIKLSVLVCMIYLNNVHTQQLIPALTMTKPSLEHRL